VILLNETVSDRQEISPGSAGGRSPGPSHRVAFRSR
jgi:hypothetical protein